MKSSRASLDTSADRAKLDREWTERMISAFDGDENAFRQLSGDAAKLARQVARKYLRRSCLGEGDVEDIVQETLLALYLSRSRWQPARGALHWIAAIARNKTIDAMRSAMGRDAAPLDEEALALAAPERETAGARLDLERLLAELRPKSRQIVVAVMLHGYSFAEVASDLQISHGAGRVALHRAMRAMAQKINCEPSRRRPSRARRTAPSIVPG